MIRFSNFRIFHGSPCKKACSFLPSYRWFDVCFPVRSFLPNSTLSVCLLFSIECRNINKSGTLQPQAKSSTLSKTYIFGPVDGSWLSRVFTIYKRYWLRFLRRVKLSGFLTWNPAAKNWTQLSIHRHHPAYLYQRENSLAIYLSENFLEIIVTQKLFLFLFQVRGCFLPKKTFLKFRFISRENKSLFEKMKLVERIFIFSI